MAPDRCPASGRTGSRAASAARRLPRAGTAARASRGPSRGRCGGFPRCRGAAAPSAGQPEAVDLGDRAVALELIEPAIVGELRDLPSQAPPGERLGLLVDLVVDPADRAQVLLPGVALALRELRHAAGEPGLD